MNSIETQIYQVISASNGIKGADIAAKIGIEKKTVNSMLANSVALKAVVFQDENYRWHTRAKNSSAFSTSAANVPVPDKDLRNLCNYYLNCLALESSSSVSQFLTSRYSLQYAVLNGLGINDDYDVEAKNLLTRISSNRDAKAYLGYPVRIYTIHSAKGNFKKIAPIFLFPVDYSAGRVDISWLPAINMEVIKSYANAGSDALAVELVNLETELGMNEPDAEIDVDELVLRLKEIRQWDWAENIDPYSIPRAVKLDNLQDGIYNRPIIIEAEREKYTQGLEAELMTLANMPEENYRGTALWTWIKGAVQTDQEENIKPLLEVLPLNSEQAQAVETALRSNLTIVTGPPGTGKSQVVTDLLVNIAWNGKSALFSSKNNKAVDVVDARVNGLCKRPVLLRIGSNQYAHRLAEIIEGLLNARPNVADKSDMEFYRSEYDKKTQEAAQLRQAKNTIIQLRNSVDELEQKFCLTREMTERVFDILDADDLGKIEYVAKEYEKAFIAAIKENNGFFARIFWSSVGPKRELARDSAAEAYNKYSKKYGLTEADRTLRLDDAKQLYSAAVEFEKAMSIALDYRKALKKLESCESLESVDKKLAVNKAASANIAYKLWDKWLTTQAVAFTSSERSEMSNYVAAMKLAGDVDLSDNPSLKKQFTDMTKKMTKYLQCWAVTSLSAKSRVPFNPGIFDYVIIDEASQCDIASIIPLLYRAKHAVIIGDPKQLSHIAQISKQQDLALIQKHNVPPAWSYSQMSLYGLAEGKVANEDIVQLRDHFRSCAEIIEFSNEEFYDGTLRTATRYSGLRPPAGEKPGIRWIDVKGETKRPISGSAYNQDEAKAIVAELKRLVSAGYTGTIGVTTPFRKQADEIKTILEKYEPRLFEELLKKHEFIADTVHKFQGDERDLMIFSTVVTKTAPSSTLGFLGSTGNLFNVAITRARAMLVIVGDYAYCGRCEVSYLQKFAEYCGRINLAKEDKHLHREEKLGREYPWVSNPEQVSDWERVLYTALYDAGIKTIPQYSVDKYKLDLAIILNNGRKLDIEVDGALYHRNWNGELCYRDQIRNQRMFELGWDVKRFWVYQIRDDMPWCIGQIKKWLASEG